MKRSICLALSLTGVALSIAITSCGGGSLSTQPVGNITVSITQSSESVEAGGTLRRA